MHINEALYLQIPLLLKATLRPAHHRVCAFSQAVPRRESEPASVNIRLAEARGKSALLNDSSNRSVSAG